MSATESETVLETIVSAGVLDDTLTVLRSLVDEAVIHFGRDGLETQVVEAANIAMYPTVSLSSAAFESVPSGSFALGVNLERLDDALSKADADQPVSLSFDTEKRMLRMQYGRVTRNFACIDPESIRDGNDGSDIELPNHFGLAVGELTDGYDVVNMVSDGFAIRSGGDGVTFYAEGDVDDTEYHIPAEELDQPDMGEDDAESWYSLEYFGQFVDGVPSGVDTVNLHVGEEWPIKLDYEYANGDGYVEGMLAPRIRSD